MTHHLETILSHYRQERAAQESLANQKRQSETNEAIAYYQANVPAEIQRLLTNPEYNVDTDEAEVTATQTVCIYGETIKLWIWTCYATIEQRHFVGVSDPGAPQIVYKRSFEPEKENIVDFLLAVGEIIHFQTEYQRNYQPEAVDTPQHSHPATNHAREAVGLLNLAERIENENTSACVATVALANAAVAQLEQARRIADALEYLNHIDNGPLARLALLIERIAAATDKLSSAAHSYNGSGYINVRSGRI